jgi:transcriptional regulator with XRE-family HTH domain
MTSAEGLKYTPENIQSAANSVPQAPEEQEKMRLTLRSSIFEVVERKFNKLEIVGAKLREYRLRSELSQHSLEVDAEIPTRRISSLENSDTPLWLDMNSAVKLSKILGVSLEDFALIPVGAVVKAWRDEKGIKAIDIVRATGGKISITFLSQLEGGSKRSLIPEKAEIIAPALGVSRTILESRILPGEEAEEEI